MDHAALWHFTYLVIGAVLQRRQLLGKAPRAGLVAAGRHLHVQGLLGPWMILELAPAVQLRPNLGILG